MVMVADACLNSPRRANGLLCELESGWASLLTRFWTGGAGWKMAQRDTAIRGRCQKRKKHPYPPVIVIRSYANPSFVGMLWDNSESGRRECLLWKKYNLRGRRCILEALLVGGRMPEQGRRDKNDVFGGLFFLWFVFHPHLVLYIQEYTWYKTISSHFVTTF